jgi:hypothetical protein
VTQPHAFRAIKPGPIRCQTCGGWADHPCHSYELWSDIDRERIAARELAEAEEMTEKMRSPLKDVSTAAGIIERESPLFFGSGDNLSLF